MQDLLELEKRLEVFLAENRYGLVDLQVASSGRGRTFRLFVERADGSPVDLDDCVRLSPLVQLFLESLQVFNDDSALQVSSPGLDRVLKRERDFTRYAGRQIALTGRAEGRRFTVSGELSGVSEDALMIKADGLPSFLEAEGWVSRQDEVVSLPWELVVEVRLRAGE